MTQKIIEETKKIFPEVSSTIAVKTVATPQTLYKYTLSREGAFRGWASYPSQINSAIIQQETSVKGLYLVGQWVMLPSGEAGLPMSGYTGYRVAKLILRAVV